MSSGIAVLGDSMLDVYAHCDRETANPEITGGAALKIGRVELKPGGAAAVALLARSFGASVRLLSAIGQDWAGTALTDLFPRDDLSLLLAAVDGTTVKQRVVRHGRPSPTRIDFDHFSRLSWEQEEMLTAAASQCRVLLISDYAKGVCTDRLMRNAIRNARARGAVVLVAPAFGRPLSEYPGATIYKLNSREALELCPSSTPEEAALRLSRTHDATVIVTAGENGMWIASTEHTGERNSWHQSASPADLVDSCGAGDTVLATLGVFVLGGNSLRVAAKYAAKYAARQIGNLGFYAGLGEAEPSLALK